MAIEDELSRAEKALKDRLTNAGKIAKDITNKAFKELVASVKELNDELTKVTKDLEDQLDLYSEIKAQAKGFGEALKEHLPFIKDNKDLSQKLVGIYKEENKLLDKLVRYQEDLITGELDYEQAAKAVVASKNLQFAIDQRLLDIGDEIKKVEKEIAAANKEDKDNLEAKLLVFQKINSDLEGSKKSTGDMANNFQEMANEAGAVEALTGTIFAGLKKTSIGKLIDFGSVTKAMKATKAGGASTFATLSTGAKAFGASLKAALGPIGLLLIAAEAIKKIFDFFKDAMFEADKQAVSLQRSLQLNNEEANQLRNYFIENKNLLETQYKLTKDLVEAQMQLSEMNALSNLYSLDAIDAQIQLTKEYKLSADEATKLNEIFISNGESSTQAVDNAKTVSAEFFKQTGLQIRQRDLLQQASKVSGFMLATFKGSSKALFEAVAKANQLGVELGKTESIAENLLNFEQSIEDEITAEMLTGKQINLDRARLLAINNKFAEATEEVLKNFKDIEEIQGMNFFTAQAVSKVTGLTKDELADAYRIQKLQGTEAGKQYERLKEAGLESQSQALLRGELNEAQIEQANKALDAQERFNIQLERAKEIFSDLVEGGVLQSLADALEALLDSSLIAPYREQGEAKRIARELEAKQQEGVDVDLSSAESASDQITTGEYGAGIGASILAGAGIGAGIGVFGGGIGAIPGAVIGGLAGGISSALGISMADRIQEGELEKARLEASRVGIKGYENSATNASSNNSQNQPIIIQNTLTLDGEKVASSMNMLPQAR
jgi:hypothetical protein